MHIFPVLLNNGTPATDPLYPTNWCMALLYLPPISNRRFPNHTSLSRVGLSSTVFNPTFTII